jgi:predicted P-loop ATPase
MKRILNSDRIKKITPLNLFIEQLQGQPWDGVDRINPLITAAKLDQEESIKVNLITKWLCTVYSYAMRDIDKDIHYNEYSRVVLIFYSKATATGKTTFFEKLGMKGRIRELTRIKGLDVYSNFPGQISKDERELGILLESKLLIQIDDVEESIINNNGTLRSIISRNSSDNRKLHTEINVNREYNATFCGSTNHRELIKEKAETRFLIFEVKERMNFEAINNTDYIQLWSQVRHMCLKENPKNFIGPDELKMINKIAQAYCYQSDIETLIRDVYEFAEDERVELREIKNTLEQLGIRANDSQLGKAIKGLAPSGEEIYCIVRGTKKYKVKEKAVRRAQEFGGIYPDDEVTLPF